MDDKRAWLPVARELVGLRIVIGDVLLIEGPFPDDMPDCCDIAAELSIDTSTGAPQIFWQWHDAKTLKPIGDKVPIDG